MTSYFKHTCTLTYGEHLSIIPVFFPFGVYLGPKFGPIPNAKNVSIFPVDYKKIPIGKIGMNFFK